MKPRLSFPKSLFVVLLERLCLTGLWFLLCLMFRAELKANVQSGLKFFGAWIADHLEFSEH